MKVSGDSKQVVKVEKTGTPLEAALTTVVAAKMLSSLPKTQDIEGKRGRDGKELQGMNWPSAKTLSGQEVENKNYYLAQLLTNMEQFAPVSESTTKIRDMYTRLRDMGEPGQPAGNTANADLMLVYTDAIYFFNQQILQASGSGITDKRFEKDWPMKVKKIEMSVVQYLQVMADARPSTDTTRIEILTYYEHLNKFIFNYYVTTSGVDIYTDFSNSITEALTTTIRTLQGFVDDDMMEAVRTLTPPGRGSY